MSIQQVEVKVDWPIIGIKSFPNGVVVVKDPSNGRTFIVNGQGLKNYVECIDQLEKTSLRLLSIGLE